MTRVLVVGDVMRDIVVRPAGPLRPGTDTRAAIDVHPGGGAANQAAWLAHAGVPTRLLACVGAPDFEQETERLARLGVEPMLQGHPRLPTGTLIALIGPDGERSFLTDRGANDDLSPSWVPGPLDGVGHLHVSGYALVGEGTRATVVALLADAQARGLSISFDPGSAGFLADHDPAVLLAPLGAASLCVMNCDEALIVTGLVEPTRQAATLARRYGLAVVKCGAEGAYAADRDGPSWFAPACPTVVVDTIGAGDAFLAGFLAERLRGGTVPAALERGAAFGARAVGQAGGAPRQA